MDKEKEKEAYTKGEQILEAIKSLLESCLNDADEGLKSVKKITHWLIVSFIASVLLVLWSFVASVIALFVILIVCIHLVQTRFRRIDNALGRFDGAKAAIDIIFKHDPSK